MARNAGKNIVDSFFGKGPLAPLAVLVFIGWVLLKKNKVQVWDPVQQKYVLRTEE